eukprot:gene11800-8111_t
MAAPNPNHPAPSRRAHTDASPARPKAAVSSSPVARDSAKFHYEALRQWLQTPDAAYSDDDVAALCEHVKALAPLAPQVFYGGAVQLGWSVSQGLQRAAQQPSTESTGMTKVGHSAAAVGRVERGSPKAQWWSRLTRWQPLFSVVLRDVLPLCHSNPNPIPAPSRAASIADALDRLAAAMERVASLDPSTWTGHGRLAGLSADLEDRFLEAARCFPPLPSVGEGPGAQTRGEEGRRAATTAAVPPLEMLCCLWLGWWRCSWTVDSAAVALPPSSQDNPWSKDDSILTSPWRWTDLCLDRDAADLSQTPHTPAPASPAFHYIGAAVTRAVCRLWIECANPPLPDGVEPPPQGGIHPPPPPPPTGCPLVGDRTAAGWLRLVVRLPTALFARPSSPPLTSATGAGTERHDAATDDMVFLTQLHLQLSLLFVAARTLGDAEDAHTGFVAFLQRALRTRASVQPTAPPTAPNVSIPPLWARLPLYQHWALGCRVGIIDHVRRSLRSQLLAFKCYLDHPCYPSSHGASHDREEGEDVIGGGGEEKERRRRLPTPRPLQGLAVNTSNTTPAASTSSCSSSSSSTGKTELQQLPCLLHALRRTGPTATVSVLAAQGNTSAGSRAEDKRFVPYAVWEAALLAVGEMDDRFTLAARAVVAMEGEGEEEGRRSTSPLAANACSAFPVSVSAWEHQALLPLLSMCWDWAEERAEDPRCAGRSLSACGRRLLLDPITQRVARWLAESGGEPHWVVQLAAQAQGSPLSHQLPGRGRDVHPDPTPRPRPPPPTAAAGIPLSYADCVPALLASALGGDHCRGSSPPSPSPSSSNRRRPKAKVGRELMAGVMGVLLGVGVTAWCCPGAAAVLELRAVLDVLLGRCDPRQVAANEEEEEEGGGGGYGVRLAAEVQQLWRAGFDRLEAQCVALGLARLSGLLLDHKMGGWVHPYLDTLDNAISKRKSIDSPSQAPIHSNNRKTEKEEKEKEKETSAALPLHIRLLFSCGADGAAFHSRQPTPSRLMYQLWLRVMRQYATAIESHTRRLLPPYAEGGHSILSVLQGGAKRLRLLLSPLGGDGGPPRRTGSTPLGAREGETACDDDGGTVASPQTFTSRLDLFETAFCRMASAAAQARGGCGADQSPCCRLRAGATSPAPHISSPHLRFCIGSHPQRSESEATDWRFTPILPPPSATVEFVCVELSLSTSSSSSAEALVLSRQSYSYHPGPDPASCVDNGPGQSAGVSERRGASRLTLRCTTSCEIPVGPQLLQEREALRRVMAENKRQLKQGSGGSAADPTAQERDERHPGNSNAAEVAAASEKKRRWWNERLSLEEELDEIMDRVNDLLCCPSTAPPQPQGSSDARTAGSGCCPASLLLLGSLAPDLERSLTDLSHRMASEWIRRAEAAAALGMNSSPSQAGEDGAQGLQRVYSHLQQGCFVLLQGLPYLDADPPRHTLSPFPSSSSSSPSERCSRDRQPIIPDFSCSSTSPGRSMRDWEKARRLRYLLQPCIYRLALPGPTEGQEAENRRSNNSSSGSFVKKDDLTSEDHISTPLAAGAEELMANAPLLQRVTHKFLQGMHGILSWSVSTAGPPPPPPLQAQLRRAIQREGEHCTQQRRWSAAQHGGEDVSWVSRLLAKALRRMALEAPQLRADVSAATTSESGGDEAQDTACCGAGQGHTGCRDLLRLPRRHLFLCVSPGLQEVPWEAGLRACRLHSLSRIPSPTFVAHWLDAAGVGVETPSLWDSPLFLVDATATRMAPRLESWRRRRRHDDPHVELQAGQRRPSVVYVKPKTKGMEPVLPPTDLHAAAAAARRGDPSADPVERAQRAIAAGQLLPLLQKESGLGLLARRADGRDDTAPQRYSALVYVGHGAGGHLLSAPALRHAVPWWRLTRYHHRRNAATPIAAMSHTCHGSIPVSGERSPLEEAKSARAAPGTLPAVVLLGCSSAAPPHTPLLTQAQSSSVPEQDNPVEEEDHEKQWEEQPPAAAHPPFLSSSSHCPFSPQMMRSAAALLLDDGVPNAYLHAGAPAVVGCLWDVTAGEIDGLLLQLMRTAEEQPEAHGHRQGRQHGAALRFFTDGISRLRRRERIVCSAKPPVGGACLCLSLHSSTVAHPSFYLKILFFVCFVSPLSPLLHPPFPSASTTKNRPPLSLSLPLSLSNTLFCAAVSEVHITKIRSDRSVPNYYTPSSIPVDSARQGVQFLQHNSFSRTVSLITVIILLRVCCCYRIVVITIYCLLFLLYYYALSIFAQEGPRNQTLSGGVTPHSSDAVIRIETEESPASKGNCADSFICLLLSAAWDSSLQRPQRIVHSPPFFWCCRWRKACWFTPELRKTFLFFLIVFLYIYIFVTIELRRMPEHTAAVSSAPHQPPSTRRRPATAASGVTPAQHESLADHTNRSSLRQGAAASPAAAGLHRRNMERQQQQHETCHADAAARRPEPSTPKTPATPGNGGAPTSSFRQHPTPTPSCKVPKRALQLLSHAGLSLAGEERRRYLLTGGAIGKGSFGCVREAHRHLTGSADAKESANSTSASNVFSTPAGPSYVRARSTTNPRISFEGGEMQVPFSPDQDTLSLSQIEGRRDRRSYIRVAVKEIDLTKILDENKLLRIVTSAIREARLLRRVLHQLALRCLEVDTTRRPTVSQVLQELNAKLELLRLSPLNQQLAVQRRPKIYQLMRLCRPDHFVSVFPEIPRGDETASAANVLRCGEYLLMEEELYVKARRDADKSEETCPRLGGKLVTEAHETHAAAEQTAGGGTYETAADATLGQVRDDLEAIRLPAASFIDEEQILYRATTPAGPWDASDTYLSLRRGWTRVVRFGPSWRCDEHRCAGIHGESLERHETPIGEFQQRLSSTPISLPLPLPLSFICLYRSFCPFFSVVFHSIKMGSLSSSPPSPRQPRDAESVLRRAGICLDDQERRKYIKTVEPLGRWRFGAVRRIAIKELNRKLMCEGVSGQALPLPPAFFMAPTHAEEAEENSDDAGSGSSPVTLCLYARDVWAVGCLFFLMAHDGPFAFKGSSKASLSARVCERVPQ